MTSSEKTEHIVAILDEAKAESVEVVDVRAKTSVADYFVVCAGTSDRHVSALADRVAEKMVEFKVKPSRVEGERTGWVLMDYGDVIVHVMREEQRQFYDLETLWKTMQRNPDLA